MVRPKMKLEKLKNELMREHTFIHQRSIIVDKVRDLSILTGVDILFLAFSPSDIPTLCLGQYSNLNRVIRKFSSRNHEEREKRKLENLQTLKTNYARKGRNVDVEAFSNAWQRKRLEDLNEELRELTAKLSDLDHKRGLWANLKSIKSIEQIKEMEESLTKSIDGLRKRKEHLSSLTQQTYNMQAAAQLQLTWLPNYNTIYQGLQENFNPPMLQRDVGCSSQPNMVTGNMGSEPQFNFQDPFQQPSYGFSGFDMNPNGSSFNPMQQLGQSGLGYADNIFNPIAEPPVHHFSLNNAEITNVDQPIAQPLSPFY